MSQTLRREIIQIIEKDLNDYISTGMSYLGETVPPVIVEKIADDVLKVSGISNSPTARKYNDPYWDLFHGGEVDEKAVDKAKIYTAIAERLERGLLRNEFPQTTDAQKIYQWITEQEAKGESLDTWMKWAMEGPRANYSFVYHENPSRIKRDWPQAFGSKLKPSGRHSERLSDG